MDKPRLRANTFLILLLRAGRPEISGFSKWTDNQDGITRPGMLVDLLRMTDPSYTPQNSGTIASYFSKFLKGKIQSRTTYFPFENATFKSGLKVRITEEYEAVFEQMDIFCRKYLNLDNWHCRLLVGGLVDTILADDTFDGEFNTGEMIIGKEGLRNARHFVLQDFLISVWNNILIDNLDISDGAATYESWMKSNGLHSVASIVTNIGEDRAETLTVDIEPMSRLSIVENSASVYQSKENMKQEKIMDVPFEIITEGSFHEEPTLYSENQDGDHANATSEMKAKKKKKKNRNTEKYNQRAKKIINIDHPKGDIYL